MSEASSFDRRVLAAIRKAFLCFRREDEALAEGMRDTRDIGDECSDVEKMPSADSNVPCFPCFP